MNPAIRAAMVDTLTTHRHGEHKEACRWCASFYGALVDKIAPLIEGADQ